MADIVNTDWQIFCQPPISKRSCKQTPCTGLRTKELPMHTRGIYLPLQKAFFCDRVTGDLTLRVRWSHISMNNKGFRIQQQNNLTAYCVIKQPASTCLYFKDNIPKNVLKQNPNRNIPFLSLGCLGWYQAQSIHFPTLLSLYAKQYHSYTHSWWKDIHRKYVSLWALDTLGSPSAASNIENIQFKKCDNVMLNCLFVTNEQLDLSWHGTLHLPPPDTAAATTIFSF